MRRLFCETMSTMVEIITLIAMLEACETVETWPCEFTDEMFRKLAGREGSRSRVYWVCCSFSSRWMMLSESLVSMSKLRSRLEIPDQV